MYRTGVGIKVQPELKNIIIVYAPTTLILEKGEDDIMDWGHNSMQGTNYSPLGIIIQFPVRGTSLFASLHCDLLPTRPQGRDAQACVHHFVRQVEPTMLQCACAKTPRLIFVGHQLAATELQQGEKSPPHSCLPRGRDA